MLRQDFLFFTTYKIFVNFFNLFITVLTVVFCKQITQMVQRLLLQQLMHLSENINK